MQLNTNSINTKIYCWFYNKYISELPTNLCTYLCKLIIAYILIIPVSLLFFPSVIFRKITLKRISLFQQIVLSLIIYYFLILLLGLCAAFSLLFVTYNENSILFSLVTFGIILWVLIFILICIVVFILIIIKKNKNKKNKIQNKRTIFVEFIKEKYQKYCPKIKWNNE